MQDREKNEKSEIAVSLRDDLKPDAKQDKNSQRRQDNCQPYKFRHAAVSRYKNRSGSVRILVNYCKNAQFSLYEKSCFSSFMQNITKKN